MSCPEGFNPSHYPRHSVSRCYPLFRVSCWVVPDWSQAIPYCKHFIDLRRQGVEPIVRCQPAMLFLRHPTLHLQTASTRRPHLSELCPGFGLGARARRR